MRPSDDRRWTIYPHAGERIWSTEYVDEWKREIGVKVIPEAECERRVTQAWDVVDGQRDQMQALLAERDEAREQLAREQQWRVDADDLASRRGRGLAKARQQRAQAWAEADRVHAWGRKGWDLAQALEDELRQMRSEK